MRTQVRQHSVWRGGELNLRGVLLCQGRHLVIAGDFPAIHQIFYAVCGDVVSAQGDIFHPRRCGAYTGDCLTGHSLTGDGCCACITTRNVDADIRHKVPTGQLQRLIRLVNADFAPPGTGRADGNAV